MKYTLLTLMIFALFTISCTTDKIEAELPVAEKTLQNKLEKERTLSVDAMQPTTTISFDKLEYDFGDMNVGDKGETTFSFTNTGSEPLIISSAKGSCGCTVPEWPKEPIAPGNTGEMLVVFTAKAEGKQTKTVTIQANIDPNPSRLKITADVSKTSDKE